MMIRDGGSSTSVVQCSVNIRTILTASVSFCQSGSPSPAPPAATPNKAGAVVKQDSSQPGLSWDYGFLFGDVSHATDDSSKLVTNHDLGRLQLAKPIQPASQLVI